MSIHNSFSFAPTSLPARKTQGGRKAALRFPFSAGLHGRTKCVILLEIGFAVGVKPPGMVSGGQRGAGRKRETVMTTVFAAHPTLTLSMALITVAGVFLGSFMDAIAGGGGIITVPTFLLAGLPMHLALGTNKLSAGIGTMASAARFIRSGYVRWSLALPAVALALAGSAIGTRLQLMVDARYLQYLLLLVLPVVAVVVLRRRTLPEEDREMEPRRQFAVVLTASLVIGAYDGFYGPGTGTFLLLIFTRWAGLGVRSAAGEVKMVNLASNIGALCTSLLHGQVYIALGLIGAVAALAGHWAGAGMAIKNGSRIVRPTVLIVLALLAVKVLWGLL